MPWSEQDYPSSMANMDPDLRREAISIANRLVEEEDCDEARAISIARTQAKRAHWGTRVPERPVHHGQPRAEGWALREGDAEQARQLFRTREQAQRRALELAEADRGEVVLHDRDGNVRQRRRA
ncbi:hypothetical protein BRD56_09430 [Thermoplasmatales archaeon SW_10_69_26]|nr:MAG: hypothetical protein BRD56_09430 [Thermoplasmatales archaeon SW_10_69_26]